ncbi:hypothetical protein GLOIN_2v1653519 [Rhizophagus irregularis DAOM 181602=DAOM 197198]|uniref:Uncharacterized protein n=1 Tax=Rhizophagus irregularis (strain DAOM 181602 / DAOM 197198 / MUCL 43194) TaxID=747089 RepID=A0A2P4PNB1_RHIID|nr:hypothetical protein GLOIN_2v1653519 [Rhizophagus irregularis DAOM 181602=DAOM 197198]POG66872.1 hypothetical protein GLOIN_2v1653519 [Rhizophagus irregularis DAOM 181602=DAOM 197198]GET59761.1 hypothetical protein GLOIN_2v1653519 [Rhizophagus irregularis DAOM 181602=DAOM 197198]|eukprot:XP_025173738.1 hypothetical protein GLOIN_2v1653519 [Rhizophagus irregularis DAOM 181602=DAOM 197198]
MHPNIPNSPKNYLFKSFEVFLQTLHFLCIIIHKLTKKVGSKSNSHRNTFTLFISSFWIKENIIKGDTIF